MVEKKCCTVSIVENDGGYRVEYRGDKEGVRRAWTDCCDLQHADDKACCAVDRAVKRDCCTTDIREVAEGFDLVYTGDKDTLIEAAKKACAAVCRRG